MSTEQTPQPAYSHPHVVVIGAGLAGLAAAATAARAGAAVTVLDTRSPGGRARTDERDGFHVNQGPHALYRGGEGRKVLARLGVGPTGHRPRLRGSRGLIDGELGPLPITPGGLAAGGRTGTQIARVLARIAATDPLRWAGRSAREWIEDLELRPGAEAVTEALIRVTTYVADLDRLPADLALAQARSGLRRGVSYLDGGWQTLVDGLTGSATAAGAVIRPGQAARAVVGRPGAWEVVTASGRGEAITATAVVVASGAPAAARSLLPVDADWGELGPEVTAACLDLGLRRPGPRFVLGIDEPLYLAPHCPPGDLAPEGGGLVHVMRYGARAAGPDRQQLRELAELAGVREDNVAAERFLARMVVTHVLPSPEQGLSGRPPVEVANAPGLFLAGDWVGPVGWLADAALASGERAGRLAAGAAAPAPDRRPSRSRAAA
jgi:phytoene dehydrogenase-like protein